MGMRIHKKTYVDIIDTVIYFNLLALGVVTLHDFGNDLTKQCAIAYVSTLILFSLLFGTIVYHLKVLFRSRKKKKLSEPQRM